jgi:hypothetical protein
MTKAVAVKPVKIEKEKKVAKTNPPVDNSNVLTFFKLIALQGDLECPEAIFDVQDGELHASVISSDRTLAMKGKVKGEFEQFGKIGISYLPSLSKFFNTVGKNFSIEFDKNKMVLKADGSRLTTTVQEAEYIVNKLEDDKYKKIESTFEDGYELKLTKEVISDIVSKFNTLQAETIKLIFEKGTLYVEIKNNTTGTLYETEYKVENDLDGEEVQFELNSRFGALFDTLAKNMDKDDAVIINTAKEKGIAIAISLNNKVFSLKYIVALLERKD